MGAENPGPARSRGHAAGHPRLSGRQLGRRRPLRRLCGQVLGRWHSRLFRLSSCGAESAVEPTRSQNITVSWRRSATAGPAEALRTTRPPSRPRCSSRPHRSRRQRHRPIPRLALDPHSRRQDRRRLPRRRAGLALFRRDHAPIRGRNRQRGSYRDRRGLRRTGASRPREAAPIYGRILEARPRQY